MVGDHDSDAWGDRHEHDVTVDVVLLENLIGAWRIDIIVDEKPTGTVCHCPDDQTVISLDLDQANQVGVMLLSALTHAHNLQQRGRN